jgi:protein-S-isoprenylcysteine O-methyltransferase Ste14
MLTDQFNSQGQWLFRWRSYLPLVLLPLILAALLKFKYPFGSHALDLLYEFVCLAVAAAGLAMRVFTAGYAPKGTSGRGTKQMKADVLSTTGMYSIVRHPLYLANYLIFVAFLLDLENAWLVLAGSVLYWLYYERIMCAEESFLLAKHGKSFKRWARKTPAVLPRLSRWRPPNTSFSRRSALRREYTTFYLVLLVFTAIEGVGDIIVERRFDIDPVWAMIFLAGTVFYVVCRVAKKTNRLLDPQR